MKHINEIVRESLLDDDIEAASDKALIKTWVESNVSGKYKVIYLKNGSVKLRGDVIIKGYTGEVFPGDFTIASMVGDFKIEKCPNLKNISGLFKDYTDVDGDYVISNCPKLESVAGGPMTVKGNLSFTSNSSLKTLEGMPQFVYNNVYVIKNGKKFTEKIVKSYTTAPDRIVCSMEDTAIVESENINEAMDEPHLLELAQQLKKNPIEVDSIGGKSGFNQIFGKAYNKTWKGDFIRATSATFDIPFDAIDSSNVKEYNKIDDTARKAVRAVISKSHYGLILLRDHDGKYGAAVSSNKRVMPLTNEFKNNYMGWRAGWRWNAYDYTDIMSFVNKSSGAVIIMWGQDEEREVFTKRTERHQARQGMIEHTPEYYEKIAYENRKRYEKMAAQLKAQKDKEFEKIDKEVEDIVMKALKVSQQAKRNPDKYNTYEVSALNSRIYDQDRSYYERGKKRYNGEDGLLYLYDMYTKYFSSIARGDSDKYDRDTYERYKSKLLSKIDSIKDYIARKGW